MIDETTPADIRADLREGLYTAATLIAGTLLYIGAACLF